MSSPSDVDLADVATLTAALTDAGIKSVTQDPSELNTPGVFVQVTALSYELLAGVTIRLNLLALAPDVAPARAAKVLEGLVNDIMPVLDGLGLGPSGDCIFGKWVIAGSPTPLPGISIPLDLPTTQEDDT